MVYILRNNKEIEKELVFETGSYEEVSFDIESELDKHASSG